MTHFKFILYIVFVLSLGNAFGQTHIYERYASRADLEVAYLENVPLDSTTSVNVTIIIAKDSAAWKSLKEEFNISDSPFLPNIHSYKRVLRDKYDPRNSCHDNHNCCLVVVNYYRKSLSMFHYETIDQYYLITPYLTKKTSHEKD